MMPRDVFVQNESILACVVLDLTMPGMDGEQVMRVIRRTGSDIPFILCSGFDETEIARRFEGNGVSGFIHKPFKPAHLVEAVQAALLDAPAT